MTTSRLNNEQRAQVVQQLKSGASQAALARAFGVSKDCIGRVWHHHRDTAQREPTTLDMRLNALNAKLNRILAETAARAVMGRTLCPQTPPVGGQGCRERFACPRMRPARVGAR